MYKHNPNKWPFVKLVTLGPFSREVIYYISEATFFVKHSKICDDYVERSRITIAKKKKNNLNRVPFPPRRQFQSVVTNILDGDNRLEAAV